MAGWSEEREYRASVISLLKGCGRTSLLELGQTFRRPKGSVKKISTFLQQDTVFKVEGKYVSLA